MKKHLSALSCMLFLAGLFLLTGCFALPVEDPVPPPPIARVPEPRALRTQVVRRGDVYRYAQVTAFYVQTREDRLSFPLTGHLVQDIFVNIGDSVQEGDILASLEWPELTQQYAAALRREELLLLNLNQLNARRAQGLPDDTDQRNHLTRELSLLRMEMDYLRGWYQKLYLRATLDGVVSHVIPFTEGLVSDARIIVTIVDMTYSVFEIRSTDIVEYMEVGDRFTLNINRIPHEAVVVCPYEIGIDRRNARGHEVYLALVDEGVVLPSNPSANLRFEFDVARDVLFVPVRSVHRSGGRVYVYILNELGMRTMRIVETGLRGNTAYEIISGLYEGDVIVLG